jgi:hypothetical protein
MKEREKYSLTETQALLWRALSAERKAAESDLGRVEGILVLHQHIFNNLIQKNEELRREQETIDKAAVAMTDASRSLDARKAACDEFIDGLVGELGLTIEDVASATVTTSGELIVTPRAKGE